MNTIDVLQSFIESHRFVCWKCKQPVASARCHFVNDAVVVTFLCHGDEEMVPVKSLNLRSVRIAVECGRILDTLTPFSPADDSCLPQGSASAQPKLTSQATTCPNPKSAP